MTQKNVLILGAGVYQVPLIQAAQRLGCHVIAASIPGNYPGFDYADEVAYIDVLDKDTLLALAREREVCAVVTAGSDIAIASVGYICEQLSLPGINTQTAIQVTDKLSMKYALEKGNVKTARFEVVPTGQPLEHYVEIAEKIGYPTIFKTTDSSGSRGITKVFSKEDIPTAVANIDKTTRHDKFLIEELIIGREFGAQLFVANSDVVLYMPHGDYLFEGDTAVPIGHYVPFGNDVLAEAVRVESVKAIKAVGITSGAVNVDAIERDGEVFIIEIGARAGATCLSELVSERYSIDYYEAIMRNALGELVELPSEVQDTYISAMLLCSDREGVIASISIPDNLPESILDVSLDYGIGSTIRKFRIGPDRCGQVIARSNSLLQAEKDVFDTMNAIEVVFEDGTKAGWVMPEWAALRNQQ